MASLSLQKIKERAAAKIRLAQNQAAAATPPPRAEKKKQRLDQQAQFVARGLRDDRQVEICPASIDQTSPAGQSPIVPTPARPPPLETIPPSPSQ